MSVSTKPTSHTPGFWRKYPGLVWSNSKAPDSIFIRAALLEPRFHVLLGIARQFGISRLEQEWDILRCDEDTRNDTLRVEATVTRIFANLHRGYKQACA
jgi:hypothetical protein